MLADLPAEYWEEVGRVSRLAAAVHLHRGALGYDDRREAAYDGILDDTITAGRALDHAEMKRSAINGINYAALAAQHHWGLDLRRIGNKQTGRGFHRYWSGNTRIDGAAAFEERVDDRITLGQVWPHLTTRQQEILEVQASIAAGDATPASAPRMAGCSQTSWSTLLYLARKRARHLWFSPEADPGHYGRDLRTGRHDPITRYRGRVHARRRTKPLKPHNPPRETP